MKHILALLVLLPVSLIAQVGINTTNPEGTLDVVSNNNTGLVLPRVTSVEDVTDGNGGLPINGTTVYDISRAAVCFYQNDQWTCIQINEDGDPVLEDPLSPVFEEDPTYIKASNTEANDLFGGDVSISDDGNTLAVGARGEDSNATGINGSQTNNDANSSGAVYIFQQTGGIWTQQAYLKASNAGTSDSFGQSVALSGDGNTLVIGATGEDSNATGINGSQGDATFAGGSGSGAVYVFQRAGSTWTQQAYVKASNTGAIDQFGYAVAIAQDGNTFVASALREASNSNTINAGQGNNAAAVAGAAYVFVRAGSNWSQQAYLKAFNSDANDQYGESVAISSDGNTIAIGARYEDSNATGVNGNQTNNASSNSGAVYVYVRSGTTWSHESYIKSSNSEAQDQFGHSIALSGTGNLLAVGANRESSNATGINGDQTNNAATEAGAVYLFERNAGNWTQIAYIKASNTDAEDDFGQNVSLSEDGSVLVVGARLEDGNSTGVDGGNNNAAVDAGAVYVFRTSGGAWSQNGYYKASNTQADDNFGEVVAVSGDGSILVVGGDNEESNATGINGDQTNNAAPNAGAVYVYIEN